MNFDLNETQTLLIETAAKAAKQILAPIVEADEDSGTFRPEVISQLGEIGLTGIATPEQFGGAGLGYLEYVMVLEELATTGAAYPISIAVTGLPQIILSEAGTEEQKKKYIPNLASGKAIGAFSLTESAAGSDAGSLKTKATKKGDSYILNGTKLYTTQGNVAETLIVFARTSDQPGGKGVSAFVVDRKAEGVKCGKLEHKMGLNISPTCEMIYENVKLSESQRIGPEGQGFKVAKNALDSGRITIAAIAIGLARAAFEYASKYAAERTQFGQPIKEFQGIGFMLADMYTQLEAARLLVYKAAFLKDSGKPFSKEASAAKLFATDTCMKITTDAVQILGGNGYSKEYPVERYMREAKVLQIVEGTNQIQRLVISKLC